MSKRIYLKPGEKMTDYTKKEQDIMRAERKRIYHRNKDKRKTNMLISVDRKTKEMIKKKAIENEESISGYIMYLFHKDINK